MALPAAPPSSTALVTAAATPVSVAPVMPVAPPVVNWGQMSGYEQLGFSLKPPKFIRQAATAIKKAVTIKNVLKVGAIVGAAALIPGALPLLAKGAVGAAKLVTGGARLVGRGVVGAEKLVAGNIKTAAGVFTSRTGVPGTPGAPAADVFDAAGNATGGNSPIVDAGASSAPAPTISTVTDPNAYGGTSPTQAYASPMGPSASPTAPDATTPPDQAGTAPTSTSNLLPIALGVGALLLLTPTLKKRRR